MICLGCCRKIIVTLRNNVYKTNSPKEGEYRLVRNKINGKNIWISADRNHAIWYFRDRNRNGAGEWGIGLMNQIGSNRVGLGTRGNLDTQCPSNRDTWQFSDDFGKWTYSSANDVHIQCKQMRYPWDIFGMFGYKPVQPQPIFPPAPVVPLPVKKPCNCGSNEWIIVENNPNQQSPNPTSFNPPQVQTGYNPPQVQTGYNPPQVQTGPFIGKKHALKNMTSSL